MDLKYIKDVIIPQRKKEIEEGKNRGTAQPIYVVYNLIEQFYEGHGEFYGISSKFNNKYEYGYVDDFLDTEDREFEKSDKGMREPRKVTRFFTDEFVSLFFTRKGAGEYMKYQKHNLTNPHIYIHHPGHRNVEMNCMLCDN